MAQAPRICIPLVTYDNMAPPRYGVHQSYVHGITKAGGEVLCIIRPTEEKIHELLPLIDGIFLVGGCDIDPEQYHEKNTGHSRDIDSDRDHIELTLVRLAREENIPLLGVCRGSQIINVACGGSLYQDISLQLPGALEHDQHKDPSSEGERPRNFLAHNVAITKNTLLSQLINKDAITVNSLHHQGIKTLGEGLAASAIAPDGLIEAIELPDHPFLLGVEWHPEALDDESSQKIFSAFITAAQAKN